MKAFMRLGPLCSFAVILSTCVLAVLVIPARAIGASSLTFRELDKGGTFEFIDNAPKATLKHGVVSLSMGDELITTNPIAIEGRVVGKIRIVCTATSAGNTKNPARAGFICTAIARLPGGSLILVGELSNGPAEGAVTGGTGSYAGATGTFVSRPGRGYSTNTVTLLE